MNRTFQDDVFNACKTKGLVEQDTLPKRNYLEIQPYSENYILGKKVIKKQKKRYFQKEPHREKHINLYKLLQTISVPLFSIHSPRNTEKKSFNQRIQHQSLTNLVSELPGDGPYKILKKDKKGLKHHAHEK